MSSQERVVAFVKSIPWLANMDHHMKDVVREGSVAFLLRITGLGVAYILNVLLARFLGAEGAGLYYLALAVTTVAATIARLGMDNALLRFLAASVAEGEWAKVVGIYRQGIGIGALSSAIVSIVLFASASWISLHLFSEPDLSRPLQIMTLSILPLSLFTLFSQLLRGLERIAESSLVQSLAAPLLNLPLLILLHRPFGLLGAVIAYVVATALTLVLSVGLWKHETTRFKTFRGSFDAQLLLTTSVPLLWVTVMNLTMNWTDILFLGAWEESSSVGVYGTAVRVARFTGVILIAVNSIIAPKFAALYAQREYRALGALARNTAKLSTLVSLPLFVVLIFMPQWIMRFFGAEFASGATVLAILSAGQLVNVITGSVGYLLMMCGYEKLLRNNTAVFAVFNIILNAVLIPKFGIVGAAFASSASLALMNLAAVWLVYRELSIVTIPIPKRLYGA